MVKTASNHLLSFFAGSVLSLGVVTGVNHGRFSASELTDVANAFGGLSAFGVALLAYVAAAILVTTLLVLYWSEVVAFSKRIVRRPGLLSSSLASQSAERSTPRLGDVNIVRDELERQLGRLIVLIAGHLQNSKDHAASLKDTNAHLATVTSAAELRGVVQSLISKNEQSQHQTSDLEARLREAQAQAETLRQRLNQAEKLASLDPLTSIANRRRFEQFVAMEIDKSHQDGTPLCLIMTDIDHFKKVNDTFGHSAGDRVLKAFADLLTNNVRGSDLVARYGGEEFAIVLPRTPMGNAFVIAERIRSKFELHGGPDETLVNEFGRLTASFGVAEIREGEPPSVLIERADQMLYEAKNKGRNRTLTWNTVAEALRA
jgi:diguanylate cyclase